jgi:hypothetical protein
MTNRHAPLRKATGYILSIPEMENKLTTFDQLVSPLTFLGGGYGDADYAEVSVGLIQSTFKSKEPSQYMTDYAEIFPNIKVDTSKHQQLLMRRAHRSGREVHNELG